MRIATARLFPRRRVPLVVEIIDLVEGFVSLNVDFVAGSQDRWVYEQTPFFGIICAEQLSSRMELAVFGKEEYEDGRKG